VRAFKAACRPAFSDSVNFIASCKRSGVEPFASFRNVLARIPAHSITRLNEFLPHNRKPTISAAEA
jgi:hypothetical protein